jgi:hypothetical protein
MVQYFTGLRVDPIGSISLLPKACVQILVRSSTGSRKSGELIELMAVLSIYVSLYVGHCLF